MNDFIANNATFYFWFGVVLVVLGLVLTVAAHWVIREAKDILDRSQRYEGYLDEFMEASSEEVTRTLEAHIDEWIGVAA